MPAHVVTPRACCRLTLSPTQQKGLSEQGVSLCLLFVGSQIKLKQDSLQTQLTEDFLAL